MKLIFVTVFQITLKPVEKSKEDLQETVQMLRQKLFEQKPMSQESSLIENPQEICQEIIEILQNNVFNLLEENSPHSPNNIHSTKCKILNPDLKPLNFLEENLDNSNVSTLFFPDAFPTDNLLYGTKNFYIFIRFFYIFYEQILMAYQLSQKFENASNFSNLNEEVNLFRFFHSLFFPKEKQFLSKERYRVFKLLLVRTFYQKMDSTIFENNLRCLFGNNSFLLATSEKILVSVIFYQLIHKFIFYILDI